VIPRGSLGLNSRLIRLISRAAVHQLLDERVREFHTFLDGALVDRALQRPHGGDRKSEDIKIDNVQIDAPTGNTQTAALRRPRKDRPDLHAQPPYCRHG
jgi:hypothetical protein